MTVKMIATIKRFKGVSTDNKPIVSIPEGSTFYETDTGNRFIWQNSSWIEDLSDFLSIGKMVSLGNEQRRLLEEILIELKIANKNI